MSAGTVKHLALVALAIFLGYSVAAAETLTDSLQSDTAGLYAVIKEGVQRGFADESVKQARYLKEAMKAKKYVLDDCEAPGLNIGSSKSEALDSLGSVAGTAIRLSNDLRKLGYPPEVWEPLIRDFERREIETVRAGATQHRTDEEMSELLATVSAEDLYKDLVTVLARYRNAHPSLARVVVEGSGCGVGEEVEVTIKTRPSGGTVYFISSFDYKVCKARNLDADDRTSCNIWHEFVEGNPEHMLGDYEYVAIWENRAPKRSRFKINNSSNSNWQQTLTITP